MVYFFLTAWVWASRLSRWVAKPMGGGVAVRARLCCVLGACGFVPVKFSRLKEVVGRRSKTPTRVCAKTNNVGLCEYRPTPGFTGRYALRSGCLWIRPREVFKTQRICRSAVEDPDIGLCQNQQCRTLRVPTYEMTCLTHFKLPRAGSIDR